MTNVNWDNVTSPSDTIPYTEWINMVGYIKSVIVTDGNVDAGVITSGVLDISTIPALDASNIVTGTFDVARIPDLSANKITSDTFNTSRIPSLDASKITTGYLSTARLGSGTADNTKFLRGDQTWQVVSGGGGGEPLYNAWIAASNAVAGSATGSYAIAIGQSSVANQTNALAFGAGSAATGVNSFSVLGGATGANSISIGIASQALGADAIAIGDSLIATGNYSLAMGLGSLTPDEHTIALGSYSLASGGGYGTAIGAVSHATGYKSLAIGTNATASGEGAISLGNGNVVSGYYASALGSGNSVSGVRALGLGNGATASGQDSFAVGQNSFATGTQGIAIGQNSSSGEASVALGVSAVASAQNSISIGDGPDATAYGSIAIGLNTQAIGLSSIAIGDNAQATGSENYSIVMGINSVVNGSESIAIGSSSQALSNKSTAIGGSTIASGFNSTAIGFGTFAHNNAVALGNTAQATAENTVAIGQDAQATTNPQSIAIGASSRASALNSVSFGYGVTNSVANTINIGTNSKTGVHINTDLNKTIFYNSIELTPTLQPGSPTVGQQYYDISANKMYFWNSTAWVEMAGGGGGSVFNTITLTPQGAPLAPTIGEHYFDTNTERLYYWDGVDWEEVAEGQFCDQKSDTFNFAYGGYYSVTEWRGLSVIPLYDLIIDRVYLFAQGATRLRCTDSTRTKIFWEILNPVEGYNDIPRNIMLEKGDTYYIECYADGAAYNAGRSGNNQGYPQNGSRMSNTGGSIDGVFNFYNWTIYEVRTQRAGTSEEDPVFTGWKNGSSITAGLNATGYTRAVILGESAGGASPQYSVLIGYAASSYNGMSVAIGGGANTGAAGVAIGYGATHVNQYSYYNTCVGYQAGADAGSTSLGSNAYATGGSAIAIGNTAIASNTYAVSIGSGVTNAIANTVNIGTNSKIGLTINTDTDTTTINNSLALTPQAQPTGIAGKQYYDSGTHKMYYHNDTTWVEMSGGGGGGGAPYTYLSSVEGAIYTTTLLYHIVNTAGTISEARATLGSLPTGQNVLIDVRKNGNLSTDSIFTSDLPVEITTTQSPVNGVYSSTGTLDAGRTTVAVGDVLFVTITQIGSGLAGADLRVQIKVA